MQAEFTHGAGDRDGKYTSVQRFVGAEEAGGGELSRVCLGYTGTLSELLILCDGTILSLFST